TPERARQAPAPAPNPHPPPPPAHPAAPAHINTHKHPRVLLVDPVYKPDWDFPGGVVERGEAPTDAALRETAEELGLRLDPTGLRLLAVDWEPRTGPRRGGLRLMYDGGQLDAAARQNLLLQAEELRDWRFVTLDEAADLLPPSRYRRLAAALDARRSGELRYLEAGRRVALGLASTADAA
ncbi:NUDIX domain-containing protein, partial [Kitasatospora sp. NPDC059803]|uniref:NUDIX domain-containing protein n=1 Tax=Kitasatospora sp. NPDC059803 TaxID=3346953 RepID=UPI003660E7B5